MITQVTKEIHRFLELHILDLQNDKISIANHYLKNYEQYVQALRLINSYIKEIETFMDEVQIGAGEHTAPFVIIGSTVELEDLAEQKTRRFYISVSDGGGALEEAGDAELTLFLSDIGRKLLLREAGEIIQLKDGDSGAKYKIVRISYNLNL